MKEIHRKIKQVAKPIQPLRVNVISELSDEDCIVWGNETQISQMALNLVLNAFHAMEEAGGIMTVSLYEEEKNVVMKIKDTGIGISQENMKRIFEPFFTTKETGKGTGLGLAIVQQVVSEHNGEIEVESEVSKGTEITVRLPKTES